MKYRAWIKGWFANFIKQKIKSLYNIKLMTFKQKYIHEKGPFPFDFEQ